jgi:pimeloyl-ACP methyl ester carboxylesterase
MRSHGRFAIPAILVAAVALLMAGMAGPAQADSPPAPSVLAAPVQTIAVSGAVLGYRVAGTGFPLVLVTGSGSTMAEWDPRMLDQLALTHHVIVFDNRGAGTSTGAVDKLTVALMARDTAQLIALVAPGGTADVLGWSMGSYVAQELAITAPSRVQRLVLASADCGGPTTLPPTKQALKILLDPHATAQQRSILLFPANQAAAAGAWGAAIGEAYAAAHYQPSDAFTVRPATMAAQVKASGALWLGKGHGTCSRLGRISQPTLIGLGKQDIVVPAPNHRILMAGIPRATLRSYFDAGHGFLFQPALGFTDAVATFLG